MANQGRNFNQSNWDGQERRGVDRRGALDDQPTYFEQMIINHLQHQGQAQPAAPKPPENITQSTLTLSQIGSIVMAVAGLIFGGFSAWNNLNRDIELEKNNFASFKESIVKDMDGLEKTLDELKKANNELKLDNKKSLEVIDRRIQDLDNTVSQIYQKVSSSNSSRK